MATTLTKAEVLARLEEEIASLKPDKDRGLWLSLSRPERTQLRYRYDALLENRNRIAEIPRYTPLRTHSIGQHLLLMAPSEF